MRNSRRQRTESNSVEYSSPMSPRTSVDSQAKSPFKYLEVDNILFVGANLSRQCWVCAECQSAIAPAPNRTVLAEPSMLSYFVRKTNSVTEAGVNLLTLQATEDMPTEGPIVNIESPQLAAQVPSLSGYLSSVMSPNSAILETNHARNTHLKWALSNKKTELGPVQTWADACILEAFNKLHRATGAPWLELRDGELTFEQSKSDIDETSSKLQSASNSLDQARLCYYSGQYYCSKCHWGDSFQVPACVFVLMDARPKPVRYFVDIESFFDNPI